jgi:hypothetical protein
MPNRGRGRSSQISRQGACLSRFSIQIGTTLAFHPVGVAVVVAREHREWPTCKLLQPLIPTSTESETIQLFHLSTHSRVKARLKAVWPASLSCRDGGRPSAIHQTPIPSHLVIFQYSKRFPLFPLIQQTPPLQTQHPVKMSSLCQNRLNEERYAPPPRLPRI